MVGRLVLLAAIDVLLAASTAIEMRWWKLRNRAFSRSPTSGRYAAADMELTMGDPPRGTLTTTADRCANAFGR